MSTYEARQAKKDEVIATLVEYLRECVDDYEDRWITREKLHRLMKELKGMGGT